MRVMRHSWFRVDTATRPGFVLLTSPWVIDLDRGWWLSIDDGFWCDGASIPAVVRPLLSPILLLAMGVAHDYAVRPGAVLQPPEGSLLDQVPFTLSRATGLALAQAAHAGVGRVRRAAIAAGLTVAAPSYWRRRPMDWRP